MRDYFLQIEFNGHTHIVFFNLETTLEAVNTVWKWRYDYGFSYEAACEAASNILDMAREECQGSE